MRYHVILQPLQIHNHHQDRHEVEEAMLLLNEVVDQNTKLTADLTEITTTVSAEYIVVKNSKDANITKHVTF